MLGGHSKERIAASFKGSSGENNHLMLSIWVEQFDDQLSEFFRKFLKWIKVFVTFILLGKSFGE